MSEPAQAPVLRSPFPVPLPLLALLVVFPFLGWWAYGFFDMDEGYYVSVAAEMNWRGEWVTPFYNGEHWFEKPILIYWLLKPMEMLFGDSAFGLRLPSILCTLGLVALTYWSARRRLGVPTATLAALVVASTPLIAAPGRMVLLDPPFVLSLTACFLIFWESLVEDVRWRILAGFLLGVSVLGKGPVGCALFVVLAGYTFWRERELRARFRGGWIPGTLLFLAAVAAWYVPMLLQHGEAFFKWFLVEQNFGRFRGGDKAHSLSGNALAAFANLVFFVPVILVGMLPWSLFLPKAWPRRGEGTAPEAAFRRYLAAWALIVFVFFSISGTKLPHYVMPLCPPLAILVADWAVRRWGLTRRMFGFAAGWTVVLGLILIVLFPIYYRVSGQAEMHALARYVREQGRPGEAVSQFRMSRRNRKFKGTGGLKLQETTRPSLAMHMGERPYRELAAGGPVGKRELVIVTDELAKLLEAGRPVWVLTRWNRITEEDFAAVRAAGRRLEPVETPVRQEGFRLYKLTMASP